MDVTKIMNKKGGFIVTTDMLKMYIQPYDQHIEGFDASKLNFTWKILSFVG